MLKNTNVRDCFNVCVSTSCVLGVNGVLGNLLCQPVSNQTASVRNGALILFAVSSVELSRARQTFGCIETCGKKMWWSHPSKSLGPSGVLTEEEQVHCTPFEIMPP